jgi:hypothetical protein
MDAGILDVDQFAPAATEIEYEKLNDDLSAWARVSVSLIFKDRSRVTG